MSEEKISSNQQIGSDGALLFKGSLQNQIEMAVKAKVVKEIIENLKAFKTMNIKSIATGNLQADSMTNNSTGASVSVDLTRVLEELTKEISATSSVIEDLAKRISTNSTLIGTLINSSKSTGLGVGIGNKLVEGIKSGLKNNEFHGEVQKYRNRERLLGREDYTKGLIRLGGQPINTGQVGTLETLRGVVKNDVITRNTTNAKVFDNALRNETLAQYMTKLSSMNNEQMQHLKAYIKQTREPINNLADLLFAVDQSKLWQPIRRTVDEKHSSVISRLNNQDISRSLSGDFSQQLLSDISNRERFRRISTSGTTNGSLMNRLGIMGDTEFSGFTQHLQSYTTSNGKIQNMNQLTNAMNDFQSIQSRNREVIRRSNPSYLNMSNAVESITNAVNSPSLTRGINNMSGFLGSIPSLARGAASALGGLASGVASMGLSMVAEQLINVAVQDVSYNATTSKSQKNVDTAQRQVDRYTNRLSNTLDLYSSDDYGAMFMDTAGLLWNSIADLFTRGDTKVGYFETLGDINKFNSFKSTHNTTGMSDEGIIDAYLEESGLKADLEQTQAEKFQKDYNSQISSTAFQEMLVHSAKKEERERVRNGDVTFADISPTVMRERIQDSTKEISITAQEGQLTLLLDGYDKDSKQYFDIRKKQLLQIKNLYDEELKSVDQFAKELRENIDNMSESKKYEYDEDGNRVETWEYKKAKMQLGVLDSQHNELETTEVQLEVQVLQEAFNQFLLGINSAVSKIQQQSQLQTTIDSVNYDRQSGEYYEISISNLEKKINSLQQQRDSLANYDLEGMSEKEKEQEILKQDNTIASNKLELKNLRITATSGYKSKLNDFLSGQDVEYLRKRVETGASEDSPLLRNLRITQGNDRVVEFEKQISELRDSLTQATDGELKNRIESEIRDLTKQSLQAQLGILDEMKGGTGTFNLPEGVKPMTYYEHMSRNNSHQSYSIQQGDVTVQITLPNITGSTSREQLERIGAGLGNGLYQGGLGSLRSQMLGGPRVYSS